MRLKIPKPVTPAAILRSTVTVGILTLFWLGLTETFTVGGVVLGVCIGTGALLFTNLFILDGRSYADRFRMPPLTLLRYTAYLLYQIYAAGFSALIRLIRGDIRVAIVDIETDLTDDFSVALLANSITLTPGTVTLDRQGSRLKIIWLTDSEEDLPTRSRLIKGSFERILSERNV